MKVYFVTDSDESENCMIFRDKASARKYVNNGEFECKPVLHTISFAPNKKGIIRAMELAFCHANSDILRNEDL